MAGRQLELAEGICRRRPPPARRSTAPTFSLEIEPEDLERRLVAQGLSPAAFWASIPGGRRPLPIARAASYLRSFRRGRP